LNLLLRLNRQIQILNVIVYCDRQRRKASFFRTGGNGYGLSDRYVFEPEVTEVIGDGEPRVPSVSVRITEAFETPRPFSLITLPLMKTGAAVTICTSNAPMSELSPKVAGGIDGLSTGRINPR
jgi:hypothetical protein